MKTTPEKTSRQNAGKAPAFQFYYKDWLSDHRLKRASKTAKGVWQLSSPYGNDCCCFLDPSTPTWAITTGYSADDLVEHDTRTYLCLQTHTSSADDEPNVGVNWANYWSVKSTRKSCGNGNWDICAPTYGGIGKTPAYLTVTFSGIIFYDGDCGSWPSPANRKFVVVQRSGTGCYYTCGPHERTCELTEPWEGDDQWVCTVHLTPFHIVLYHGPWEDANDCCIAFRAKADDWGIGKTYAGSWGQGVIHNGVQYICKVNHTANADREPGIGVDWATYWDEDYTLLGDCDVINRNIKDGVYRSQTSGYGGTAYIECGRPTYSDWIDSHVYSIGNMVIGTDDLIYICSVGHTSSASNRPVTGGSWSSYWVLPSQECI